MGCLPIPALTNTFALVCCSLIFFNRAVKKSFFTIIIYFLIKIKSAITGLHQRSRNQLDALKNCHMGSLMENAATPGRTRAARFSGISPYRVFSIEIEKREFWENRCFVQGA